MHVDNRLFGKRIARSILPFTTDQKEITDAKDSHCYQARAF